MPLIDHRVTFDGVNKIIVANSGTVSLDVGTHLYSDWKEWVIENDNAKYLQALRTVGGDPTVGANSLGSTFFLTNGWRLRPQEANHTLDIDGNLYVDGGGDVVIPTTGSYNVLVRNTVSNLIDQVAADEGAFTATDRSMLQSLENNVHMVMSSSFLAVGLVLSGSSTTSIRTNISTSDSRFKGMQIILRSGSIGECRKIDRYQNLSGTFTVHPGFSYAPNINSEIYIIPTFNFSFSR